MKNHSPLLLIYIACTFPLLASRTTIMTFNVRREGKESNSLHTWQNRLPLVHEMLNKIKPTVLGLQEASPQQIEDIQKMLGTHYAWVGIGRQQEGFVSLFTSVDEHTPLFYNTRQYTCLHTDTFWLNPHKTPKKSGWGAWLNRICTWAQLKDKKKGTILWIFNTHLDHRSPQARVEGLKLILSEIKNKTNSRDMVILMGDFNTPVDSESLKPIIAQHGMTNTRLMAKKQSGPTWTAFNNGWSGPGKTIDHILLSCNHCRVTEHTVWMHAEGKRVSDHNPVYIRVAY